jgi:hypothetical protein
MFLTVQFQLLSVRIADKDEKPVRYLTQYLPTSKKRTDDCRGVWSGMWLLLLQIGAGLYLSVIRDVCSPGYNYTVIIHVKLLLRFFKQSILLSSSTLCGGSL